MKILITGGGGFIGSNLADRLLSEGHEVLTVDNYATSRRDNLTPQDRLTIVEGSIAEAPAGGEGFGYDPVFVPDEGDGRTFAEMTPEEKNDLSHRGRAFRTLADGLRAIAALEGELRHSWRTAR